MLQEIKIGVGAVVIENGKTLLGKRKSKLGLGKWGSFGGHLEFGETPIEAVKREAMEELGIELEEITFISCTNYLIDGLHYIDISFVSKIAFGEPSIKEPEKIEELAWFDLDALPSPLFEPVEVVLKALKTNIRYFEVAD